METMTKADRLTKARDEREAARAAIRVEPPAPAARVPVDPHTTIIVDRASGKAYTKLANIVTDPTQPRKAKNIDLDEIAALATSLRDGGQIQPIVVDWQADQEKWMIVVGERRYMAALVAGMDRIACTFIHKPLAPFFRKKMQLKENIQRAGFTDLERAEGFRDMMTLGNLTATQLAQELQLSNTTVSMALALLELPEPIRADVESGTITARAAVELGKLEGPEQAELHREVVEGGLNRAEVVSAVKEKKRRKSGRKSKKLKPVIFRTNFGTATIAAKPENVEGVLREALAQVEQQKAAA